MPTVTVVCRASGQRALWGQSHYPLFERAFTVYISQFGKNALLHIFLNLCIFSFNVSYSIKICLTSDDCSGDEHFSPYKYYLTFQLGNSLNRSKIHCTICMRKNSSPERSSSVRQILFDISHINIFVLVCILSD